MKLDKDPFPYVDSIIEKVGVENLTTQYSIPIFSTRDEFLALIAKKRGKLQKGGALDLQAAAHSILLDWSRGKIPYYAVPPKDSDSQVQTSFAIKETTNLNNDVDFCKHCRYFWFGT